MKYIYIYPIRSAISITLDLSSPLPFYFPTFILISNTPIRATVLKLKRRACF